MKAHRIVADDGVGSWFRILVKLKKIILLKRRRFFRNITVSLVLALCNLFLAFRLYPTYSRGIER